MSMGLRFVTLAVLITLTSCATGYQTRGFSGGFEEIQLSPNMWRISFEGNGYTGDDKATNFTLLRSADLTIKNGFKSFVIIDTDNGTKYSTFNNMGTTALVTKPTSSNTILMLNDTDDSRGVVYDAEFLCASLGSKYEVKCGQI